MHDRWAMDRRTWLGAALLTVALACTTDPVVCEPECAGDTSHCDPLGRCVECLMDSDCGDAAPVCASWANLCVQCASDEDCEAGFVCHESVCQPDCPLPYARDREADGGCGECASDADCAVGECRDGFCQVPSCREAPEPDGYCFIATVEGLPATGCQLQDLVWTFGFGGCGGTPRGMAPVSLCDPCYESLGGCTSCEVEGSCACTTDADCPPPTTCDDGRCAHGECREDDDCPCGQYCDGELCRLPCSSDDDCIEGRCHAPSGRCLTCLDDDDCPAGWRCYEDGCVAHCAFAPCGDLRGHCTESGRCSGCDHFTPGVHPGLASPDSCEP